MEDERNARFIEELRNGLHDDGPDGWERLKARIDSLPPDGRRVDSTETTRDPGRTRLGRLGLVAASLSIVLIAGFVLSSLIGSKPPRTVWLSMKPKEVSVASGPATHAFEDLFLDVDQALLPLDSYPKEISRRLALRLSITGNAEGVSYYVEYRIAGPTRIHHGYAVLSHGEILGLAKQGYVLGDVFVRP